MSVECLGQQHGHHHGESWEKALGEELRSFKEDDDKQRHFQAKLDHIWDNVFKVVMDSFIEDARKDGMDAALNGQTLTFNNQGRSATLIINFVKGASPSGITIQASICGYAHTFLKPGGEIESVTQKVVADFLVAALRRVKPKN